MTGLLHCADLHLAADEKEYGFAVLREILEIAQDCNAVLFCGDLFDSYADLQKLQGEVVSLVEQILDSDCRVLFLPGNHERLRATKGAGLETLAWGKIELLAQEPFSYVDLADGDILAIPHQSSYSDYPTWVIPAKSGAWRIVMAHAAVAGMHYLGPDEEESGSVIDADLFSHCGADYAAMGHIHKATVESKAQTKIVFPGSARVWRKHETGPRQVIKLEIQNGNIAHKEMQLKSAGQFRSIPATVETDGSIHLPDSMDFDPNDWLHFELYGITEEIQAMHDSQQAISQDLQARRVSFDEANVQEMKNLRQNAFARKFETVWRQKMQECQLDTGNDSQQYEERREVLLRARQLALQSIYSLSQDRS